jgi:hypothetical protein
MVSSSLSPYFSITTEQINQIFERADTPDHCTLVSSNFLPQTIPIWQPWEHGRTETCGCPGQANNLAPFNPKFFKYLFNIYLVGAGRN